VRINDIPVLFQNNVFHGNHASMYGGAIYMQNTVSPSIIHLATLINNSFSENFAVNFGGALYSYKGMPLVLNSVFFNDSTIISEGVEIYLDQSEDTIDMAFCNIDQALIHGNIFDGGNNINADPIFDDPELLTLGNGTPCKDAGTASYVCHHGDLHICPDHDILGTMRPQGGAVEIGAYEIMPEDVEDPFSTKFSSRIQFRPNPVYDHTVIGYKLDCDGPVEISLYNSYGCLIKYLLEETQQQGSHTLVFDTGNIPEGIYFCHIKTGSKSSAGKMVVVK